MAGCALTLHFCLLVFTCALSFRVSGGLDCHCKSAVSENCNENDTCTTEHGVCYAKRCRDHSSGVISMQYSCLEGAPDILNIICSQSAEDSAYKCCTGDFCNINLVVLLPSEVSSPPPAVAVATEVPGPTPTPGHVTQKPTDPPTTSTTQSPSGDLKCYCNDTLKEPDSVCVLNDYSCDGGVCSARIYRNAAGNIGTQYSCFDHGAGTDLLCSGRVDNQDQVYKCCYSGDFCNRELEVSLPKPESQSSVFSSPVKTSTVLVTPSPSIQESQSSSPVETSAAVVTQSPTGPTTPDGKESSPLFIWLSAATGGLMAIVFIIIAFFCLLTLLQIRARKHSLSKLVVNEKHRYPCNEATI